MSEVRVAEFVRRAEAAVEVPDLEALRDRGRGQARRRRASLLVAVAAVAAAGYLASGDPAADPPPVDDPRSEVPAYPGSSVLPQLEPGTYEHVLGREISPGAVRFTVPSGWHGWFGPNLPYLDRGYVGLLVGDVEEVARGACATGVSPMRDVGDGVDPLVSALSRLPRFGVAQAPTPTTLDGHDAVHLTLVGPRRAGCPGTAEIWRSPGSGDVIPSPARGSTLELWVVDLDGEAVLVSATASPGTPVWALEELRSVVASVELVPEP